MRCKNCRKRITETFCDATCKFRWLREKVSLQNQENYKTKGKDYFKRKTQKISGPSLQAIWPKGELAYKPN